MNIKKLTGVVCAVACAANFALVQPVQAWGFGPRLADAKVQEEFAQKNIQERLDKYGIRTPEFDSDECRKYTPVVQKIQKRICDLNKIEITSETFKNTYDFESKVHPIKVLERYNNASCFGAGHIYIGVPKFKGNQIAKVCPTTI